MSKQNLSPMRNTPGRRRNPSRGAPSPSGSRSAYSPSKQRAPRGRKWGFLLLIVVLAVLWNNGETIRQWLNGPEIQNENVPVVTGLHPIVAAKEKELLSIAGRKGIRVVITEGYRSSAEQNVLYRQGRSSPGKIVTYAKGGQSYHNYGLAIDFALKKPNGDIIWDMKYDGNDNGKADWLEVVDIAKKLGFTWGGDWSDFQDYPHLQMDFGLSISDLKRGRRPPSSTSP